MLARGLTNMEGVLGRHCSTDQYDREIASRHISESMERSGLEKN